VSEGCVFAFTDLSAAAIQTMSNHDVQAMAGAIDRWGIVVSSRGRVE
jgi:hypothetical protein